MGRGVDVLVGVEVGPGVGVVVGVGVGVLVTVGVGVGVAVGAGGNSSKEDTVNTAWQLILNVLLERDSNPVVDPLNSITGRLPPSPNPKEELSDCL